MESILTEIEAADAIVLGSPVSFWNVTAIFRRFLERTLGAIYWRGDKMRPVRAASGNRARQCW